MIDFLYDSTCQELTIEDSTADSETVVSISGYGDRTGASSELFTAPVTDVFGFEATEVEMSRAISYSRRGDEQQFSAESPRDETGERTLTEGVYEFRTCRILDVRGYAGTTVYIRLDVESPVRVTHQAVLEPESHSSLLISAPDGVTVTLGASPARRPVPDEITIPPDDIDALAAAMSVLRTGVLTAGPDRVYPTLRHHPPRIRTDPDASATVSLSTSVSATDREIVVGRDRKQLLAVAPLAYYLNATVSAVAGAAPRLEYGLGGSRSYPLSTPLPATVYSLLSHVVALDAVVRSAGMFEVPITGGWETLVEETACSPDLYAADPADRLATYLSIDRSWTEPLFGLGEVVHMSGTDPVAELPVLTQQLYALPTVVFGAAREPDAVGGKDVYLPKTVGKPPDPISLHHLWVTDGIAYGATKPAVDEASRRVQQPVTAELSVLYVTTTEPTGDVAAMRAAYQPPAGVDVGCEFTHVHATTPDELRTALSQDVDVVHLAAHTSDRGIECKHGYLDLTSDDVSPESGLYVLNGCSTHVYAEQLVAAGAPTVVSSFQEIGERAATAALETVVELLVRGFNLRAAMGVAQDINPVANKYGVFGDAMRYLIAGYQTPTVVHRLQSASDGGYQYTANAVPDERHSYGSVFNLLHDDELYAAPLSAGVSVDVGVDEIGDVFRPEQSLVVDSTVYQRADMAFPAAFTDGE